MGKESVGNVRGCVNGLTPFYTGQLEVAATIPKPLAPQPSNQTLTRVSQPSYPPATLALVGCRCAAVSTAWPSHVQGSWCWRWWGHSPHHVCSFLPAPSPLHATPLPLLPSTQCRCVAVSTAWPSLAQGSWWWRRWGRSRGWAAGSETRGRGTAWRSSACLPALRV